MNNIDIDGINNLSVVTDLFSKVNGLSNDNCILVVLNRDYVATYNSNDDLNRNATRVGAKTGGVAGGIVGGVLASSINNTVQKAVSEFRSKLNDKQKIVFDTSLYCGFLVNITNNGVGIIPLTNGSKLLVKIKDLKTDIDNYVYFSKDEIEKIEIQKLPLNFKSKKLAIYFKNLDSTCTPWTLPKKHKLVSYQKDNFNKLVNMLK